MDDQSLDLSEKTSKATDSTRKHIRGSSLLLLGRLVMLGLNFGVQVLTVRYLTKSDFGAFSFALAFVGMSAVVSLFGLDKAVSRYVAIYHEQQDYPRMFGTILLTLFSILGIGALVIGGVLIFQDLIQVLLKTDDLSVSLLLILIATAPIQALESYFQDMLAVFASARTIFFRRYLLGPALKLLAVLVVVLLKGDVFLLAAGYLAGSVLGLGIYAWIMLQVWQKKGVLEHFDRKTILFPYREIFGFSVPLLTTDFLHVVKGSATVLLLEYFRASTDVAEFRAVAPVAGLNLVVMQSFKLLYTPMAARLFATRDEAGINNLYWKTATWIALFSFPVFLVTFSLADLITVLLFGQQYAQSGILLALLSFGNYFNAALGFNSYTLRVYGRVKYIVLIDVLSAVLNLGLSLLLIPPYGALGAAIGTCVTSVIYNLLNHAGLLLGTGINLFERRYLMVYASILLSAAGLLLFASLAPVPMAVSLALSGVVSLALLRINRETLDVKSTFPELLRLPLVRPILGS
jgi:O-antigen/teichoic acid export membrane protein